VILLALFRVVHLQRYYRNGPLYCQIPLL